MGIGSRFVGVFDAVFTFKKHFTTMDDHPMDSFSGALQMYHVIFVTANEI